MNIASICHTKCCLAGWLTGWSVDPPSSNEMRWRESSSALTLDRCPMDITCHGIKMYPPRGNCGPVMNNVHHFMVVDMRGDLK